MPLTTNVTLGESFTGIDILNLFSFNSIIYFKSSSVIPNDFALLREIEKRDTTSFVNSLFLDIN